MTVTSDNPSPYAPPSAVLSIVQRHRDKGLPSPVDADVLARAGISQSLIPRTLQALQLLDLINVEGKPTEIFERIRLAPEADYQQRLAEWLQTAYADALQYIDPATATETQIRDAFRSYRPTGQQARMVSLFIGLFSAAGIAPEKPKSAPRRNKVKAPSSKSRKSPAPQRPFVASRSPSLSDGLPPALTGLLTSLPEQGQGWTQERRDGFIAAFGSVVDYLYPIIEPNIDTDET